MVIRAKKIFVVVAYDISDNKRRAKVVKILERYGARINFSVFECMLTDRQYAKMRNAVDESIVFKEDKIVYYPICMNCFAKLYTSYLCPGFMKKLRLYDGIIEL